MHLWANVGKDIVNVSKRCLLACCICCSLFLFSNVVVFQMLANSKAKQFTPAKRELEWKRKRFLSLKSSRSSSSDSEPPRVPFHLTELEMNAFDQRISSFPFPAHLGSKLKRPFADASRMKSNDYINLLSDIGIMALGECKSLGYDQRRVLHRLMRMAQFLNRRVISTAKLKQWELELREILSECAPSTSTVCCIFREPFSSWDPR